MLRIIGLIAASTLIGSVCGCTSMRFTQPDGMTVDDAYRGGDTCGDNLRIDDAPSPTARPRIVPIMVPPEAMAVYVPRHADRENRMWIGDHWLYIELTAGGFFAEQVHEETPESSESVGDREIEDLKSLTSGLKKITVPYKKRSAP